MFTSVILLCVSSCENAKIKQLKNEIEAANKDCPISIGVLGDVQHIEYNNKNNSVEYLILTDGAVFNNFVRDNIYLLYRTARLEFVEGDKKDFLKLLIDAEVNFEYIYKSKSTGEVLSVYFSLEDLKEIESMPLSESERVQLLLDDLVLLLNSSCPVTLEDGLIMLGFNYDSNNVVYSYLADEFNYNIDELTEGRELLKARLHNICRISL